MGHREELTSAKDAKPDRTGTLLRRVPGPVRPRRVVLDEVEKYAADLRRRLDPALHFLYVPDPHKVYRWKLALACGHTTEFLTRGTDDFPDDHLHRDPVHRTCLNPGEWWCRAEEHIDVPRPSANITEWVSSEIKEFPADPVEAPDGWEPEMWAVIRHDEPHSSRFWRVRLACGHENEHVVTAVDWTPDEPLSLVTAERAEEMRVEMEEYWTGNPSSSVQEDISREHWRKMIAVRFPRPAPEQECWTCLRAVAITGYQRIGWLIPPPRPPKLAKSNRELLEERVARAEAEVARLRRDLNELD